MPFRSYCLVIMLLLAAVPASAITREEAATVVADRYRITTPGTFGGFVAIGSVVTPKQAGLRANRPSKAFTPNLIKEHRLVVAGGGNLPLGGGHDGALKPGDRLHVYEVSTGPDYVQLDLFTVATYVLPGSGKQGPLPLQASVRFQYEGGLAIISAPKLINDIEEWLTTTGESSPVLPALSQPSAGTTSPHGAESTIKTTRTIRLGQTQDEVLAILGPPGMQIILEDKVVFGYDKIKVIFKDGKVTDAE